MTKLFTLIVTFCSLFSPALYSDNLNDIPGIFIEREVDVKSATLSLFKARYQQCVNLKKQNMKLKAEQPSFWKTASLSYSPEYVRNMTTLPSSEPPWEAEKVGLNREKEYFFNDHYVLINEKFSYEISKDGLCRLIKMKKESRTIDDGKTITRSVRSTLPRTINPKEPFDDPWMENVSFNKSRVKKNISPVIGSTQSKQKLSGISKDQDLTEKLAALKLLNSNQAATTPSTEQTPGTKSLAENIKAIKDAFAFNIEKAGNLSGPSSNQDNGAAGQPCDWVKPEKLNSNVCYWSTSYTYPSTLRRPIILKKNYSDTSEEAVAFQFIQSMPENIMQIPK